MVDVVVVDVDVVVVVVDVVVVDVEVDSFHFSKAMYSHQFDE